MIRIYRCPLGDLCTGSDASIEFHIFIDRKPSIYIKHDGGVGIYGGMTHTKFKDIHQDVPDIWPLVYES